VTCAWCSPKAKRGSHGICPACTERMLREMDEPKPEPEEEAWPLSRQRAAAI
jgi:hypothetical protein